MIVKKLEGVIAPLLTPFKSNGNIDHDKFNRNLERLNEDMLAGFYVLGSTGEASFLSEKEKLRLIEATVENADRNKLILVGSGLESTRETIRLTNQAASAGADAAVVITPSFYGRQLTDEAIIGYYSDVADASSIPIIIFNAPQFTKSNISVEAVSVLSKKTNIIGIKDNSADIGRLAELQRYLTSDFNILAGSASQWFPALTLGIQAGILPVAACAPNECSGIQQAFEKGNITEAYDIFMRVFPVIYTIETEYGVPGIKYIADLVGYEGGEVRKPLLPLTKQGRDDLRSLLSAAQLFIE